MRKTNFYLILYLISLVIMGSNGILAHFINHTGIEIVFLRSLIGSIVLIIVCVLKKEKFKCLKDPHDALFLFLSGLALGGGWIFLFEAYNIIGVSISTLLYYLGPMIAILFTPIFFKEKLTFIKIIGAVIVFVGMIFLNGKLVGDLSKLQGIIYGFLAGLLYAVMVILNKKVKHATDMENTTCQIVSSFILVFVYLSFTKGIHIKISGSEWMPVLWLGIVNTGLSVFFYYSSITKLPMSTVAILSYLDPVSAVILSMLILGETFVISQIFGVIMIIGGAIISQLDIKFDNKV